MLTNTVYLLPAPPSHGQAIFLSTSNQIYSLLLTIYNINLTGSKLRKPDFVTRLENEITRDHGRYDRYISSLDAANGTVPQAGNGIQEVVVPASVQEVVVPASTQEEIFGDYTMDEVV